MGDRVEAHCCNEMTRAVSSARELHSDRYDCADALMVYVPKFDECGWKRSRKIAYRRLAQDG